MSNKAPSFFAIARQPKWIGALFLSLLVAAIFAALGQWQLERSFTKDAPEHTNYKIEKVEVKIDTENIYIVANRLQDGELGFWLVGNSTDAASKSLTIVFGWSANLTQLESERDAIIQSQLAKFDTHLEGVLIPSEAPLPQKNAKPFILESLSLAQLINLYSPDKSIATESQILALTGANQASAWPPLSPVKVVYPEGQKINWLSAFYFLEWLVFAGFAVFLWWRLVRDEQIRLGTER